MCYAGMVRVTTCVTVLSPCLPHSKSSDLISSSCDQILFPRLICVGRGSLWSSSCLRDSGVVTSVCATVLFLSLELQGKSRLK